PCGRWWPSRSTYWSSTGSPQAGRVWTATRTKRTSTTPSTTVDTGQPRPHPGPYVHPRTPVNTASTPAELPAPALLSAAYSGQHTCVGAPQRWRDESGRGAHGGG